MANLIERIDTNLDPTQSLGNGWFNNRTGTPHHEQLDLPHPSYGDYIGTDTINKFETQGFEFNPPADAVNSSIVKIRQFFVYQLDNICDPLGMGDTTIYVRIRYRKENNVFGPFVSLDLSDNGVPDLLIYTWFPTGLKMSDFATGGSPTHRLRMQHNNKDTNGGWGTGSPCPKPDFRFLDTYLEITYVPSAARITATDADLTYDAIAAKITATDMDLAYQATPDQVVVLERDRELAKPVRLKERVVVLQRNRDNPVRLKERLVRLQEDRFTGPIRLRRPR